MKDSSSVIVKPALSPALDTFVKRVFYYLAALSLFAIARVLDSGVDYIYHYQPHVLYWITGHPQIYDLAGFYNPPWLVWVLAPLEIFPSQWTLPLFQLFIILSLVVALDLITNAYSGYTKLLSMMLCLVNLVVFDLANRGQIDTFPLLGLALFVFGRPNWLKSGVGYTLLSIKPPNTIPLMVYFFIRDWATGSFKEAVKGLIIPVGVLVLSFLVHGWWPGQALKLLTQSPPYDTWRTTIWRAAQVLKTGPVFPVAFCLVFVGLTIWFWRYANNRTKQLALLVLATFLVTPYALTYHYILVLALVLPPLLAWKWWVGVGLYLLTLLPVARLFLSAEYSFIDLVFILGCFGSVAVWLVTTHQTNPVPAQTRPAKVLLSE